MAGQAENTALDGFPPGFNLFSLEGMEGLNTKAQRPAIKDQQWSWSQNFIPIGEANARVIWGVGGLNYTAPGGLTGGWGPAAGLEAPPGFSPPPLARSSARRLSSGASLRACTSLTSASSR